ncbi:GNAT family N-acetyltransferase [Tabrizicola sp. TH137]|uniref:GNAT family N-acetyltransferase n=1 Tax=Tabrizicola sp. TH137 TaxID=2067452 RepID=UPI000C7D357B|nr:GNAT family N-acetyltransferase [Tabrizicola sp. TH137]PLL13361.1 GNAT family N-acetyltransferase [Tabrizicola sp. TH137]
MTVVIRDAGPADEAGWRGLWDQYLDFYEVVLAPEVTAATWARLMDPASPVKARLAFDGGQMVGFAIHLHHPSTWVLGEDCYLEDLFLAPEARGKKIGKRLLNDLIKLAKAKGWQRLYWHTDEENAVARRLYDRFVKADGHVRYRMTL